MDASLPLTTATPNRTHPLLLVAAASVTVLSLLGVARLAGWTPASGASSAEPAAIAAKAAAPVPPITVQQTVSLPPTTKVTTPQSASRPAERVQANAPARRSSPTVDVIDARPATTVPVSTVPAAVLPPVICRDCGIVETVREIPLEGTASGGGAVVGGLLGGVVGNQFGQGRGRDLMTLIGIAGGAYAGNQIEKSGKKTSRHDVVVRFEDGTTQTFSSDTAPQWHSGDRVRLQNGQLLPRA